MNAVNLQLPLATLLSAQVVRWVVWSGLVGLTIALLILMRTRWGQSQPLRKCIVLSLLAHLLLAIYTTTVNIVTGGGGAGDGQAMRVAIIGDSTSDASADASNSADARSEPWEHFNTASPTDVGADTLPGPEAEPSDVDSRPTRRSPREIPAPDLIPHHTNASTIKPAEAIEISQPQRHDNSTASSPGPDGVAPQRADETGEPLVDHPTGVGMTKIAVADSQSDATGIGALLRGNERPAAAAPLDGADDESASDAAGGAKSAGSSKIGKANSYQPPKVYGLRSGGNHTKAAEAGGGSGDTEAAVKAALVFLAAHQSADGRFNPRALEAGREVKVDGQDRSGAGSHADTGITGLALLSFLASGHTHLDGAHQKVVRLGLEFLLGSQAADGSLAGDAELYEKMYCHAMATCALSEAYAMTGDKRLEAAARRAVNYSIRSQHDASGGWRYQPGEPGDTSQLGWQVMALKSAELAGIEIPDRTRAGIDRFLKSVSSGRSGGLASYRPGHQISRTMTAEALVCRQFLGMARDNPAGDEAGNYVLEELPGEGRPNVYYWYYATLSMYQLQGTHWERWNKALQAQLLKTQRSDGDLAGSWDPDAVWGAYGGRAYSTALSALCLEVYYRFLPLYVEAVARDNRAK